MTIYFGVFLDANSLGERHEWIAYNFSEHTYPWLLTFIWFIFVEQSKQQILSLAVRSNGRSSRYLYQTETQMLMQVWDMLQHLMTSGYIRSSNCCWMTVRADVAQDWRREESLWIDFVDQKKVAASLSRLLKTR